VSDTASGPSDGMGLQFSVYPLRQDDIDTPIRAAISAAAEAGAEVRVGRLSTLASGDEDSLFRAVRAAFSAAASLGPVVMVVTLTSGTPSDDTVAEIQAAL
jgi:uncharacterized protein YqgV (UPF0045/DUF77 family)